MDGFYWLFIFLLCLCNFLAWVFIFLHWLFFFPIHLVYYVRLDCVFGFAWVGKQMSSAYRSTVTGHKLRDRRINLREKYYYILRDWDIYQWFCKRKYCLWVAVYHIIANKEYSDHKNYQMNGKRPPIVKLPERNFCALKQKGLCKMEKLFECRTLKTSWT